MLIYFSYYIAHEVQLIRIEVIDVNYCMPMKLRIMKEVN